MLLGRKKRYIWANVQRYVLNFQREPMTERLSAFLLTANEKHFLFLAFAEHRETFLVSRSGSAVPFPHSGPERTAEHSADNPQPHRKVRQSERPRRHGGGSVVPV